MPEGFTMLNRDAASEDGPEKPQKHGKGSILEQGSAIQ